MGPEAEAQIASGDAASEQRVALKQEEQGVVSSTEKCGVKDIKSLLTYLAF
jgi:hypothetical protein